MRPASPVTDPERPKFPCNFPRNTEIRSGDEFADDCLHRQTQKGSRIYDRVMSAKVRSRNISTSITPSRANSTSFRVTLSLSSRASLELVRSFLCLSAVQTDLWARDM